MAGTLSKERQILDALRLADKSGVTNVELSKIALRYGGYLGSLYKKGYQIDKQSIGNNVYRYFLIKEPDVEFAEGMSAREKLIKAVEELGSVSSDSLNNILVDLGLTIRHKAGTHQK